MYLFTVNIRNTRKIYEIYSKLTMKTPKRRHSRRFDVFIARFEYISLFLLVFLLLTWSMYWVFNKVYDLYETKKINQRKFLQYSF